MEKNLQAKSPLSKKRFPVSMVISGQIKSRMNEIGGEKLFLFNLSKFKNLNPDNEIIISTFPSEEITGLHSVVDKVIINIDPGANIYRVVPWPLGTKSKRSSSNNSRIFTASLSGLIACSNSVVVKTRIELIPENTDLFQKWLEDLLENNRLIEENKLGIFIEHYSGINSAIDGTLGMLPMTVQVGSKNNLIEVYKKAKELWTENFDLFTRRKFLYPITDEQIFGLCYLSLHCNFQLEKSRKKLKYYYLSSNLLRSILMLEKEFLIPTRYANSGFTRNRFKGTASIRKQAMFTQSDANTFCKKLMIVLAKRIYHFTRRNYRGLINELYRVR